MQILVVCSANRCRSPMAARWLQARLSGLGPAAVVSSAGLGPSGMPATAETVAVMAEVGIDLGPHRSEHVRRHHCDAADLIIGMTRQHVMELALIAPEAWPRTFSLVDLLRRTRQIDARQDNESPEAWIRRVHGGRTRSSVLALAAADDIADPTGKPVAAFRRTRDELDVMSSELARRLAPSATQTG